MSNVNDRLAALVPGMLDRLGFDVVLQWREPAENADFDVTSSPWGTVATVRAVWEAANKGDLSLDAGGPVAVASRKMVIAFRPDVRSPDTAVNLRVLHDGIAYKVMSVDPVGDRVALRFTLEAGSEGYDSGDISNPIAVPPPNEITADME